MLLRHAALSLSLPPGRQAGRRADLDGAQQRASCQAAPAPPAQPALPRTDTSPPVPPRAGPGAEQAGLQPGPRRDPHRPPARPRTALRRALPDAHELPGLPPGTAESKASSGGKRPRGARHTTAPLAPLHGQAVQKGAGTGAEQQLDHDGYSGAAKSTRLKESGATSTGTPDIQLVATKSSLANRGE